MKVIHVFPPYQENYLMVPAMHMIKPGVPDVQV
ncbi:hypothetical protein MTY_2351 [Moorella thermoacetica Y72]|uniref:Uncharacterized protein n=1 Tax=Moorella thermoacetica Y72 TaxID=1325331 RepID=A0A0S6UDF5_NEOTH|nr:hypothetical protein MTY_2351 [Moorella thermoacetica Y72]